MSRLGKWRSDRRGIAALEFAFAFPVMIMLTIGTIELALMMLLDASLELAVAEASRAGSLSQSGTAAEREEAAKTIVDTWVSRWLPGSSKISIETFTYPNLSDINKPTWTDRDKDGNCDPGEGTCPPNGVELTPGIGISGSLTLYTVTLTRRGFTGVFNMAGISELTFVRQAVVLNE